MTQPPKRDNLLTRRYLEELRDSKGLSMGEIADRAAIQRSQLYWAKDRSVGAAAAERLSRYVARTLGLDDEQRLELKAEIMGYPGELLRACLLPASSSSAATNLSDSEIHRIIRGESMEHSTGTKILDYLRTQSAPAQLMAEIESRMEPPPKRPRSIRGTSERGHERRRRIDSSMNDLSRAKPAVHEALERSGLSKTALRREAGVSHSTVTRALYQRVATPAAEAISDALRRTADLSEAEAQRVRDELLAAPESSR